MLLRTVYTAYRGLTPYLLVRCQVAVPRDVSVLNPLCDVGTSWRLKSDQELKRTHDEIMSLLDESPYGPYHFLTLIFGQETATRLAVLKHCNLPPPSQRRPRAPQSHPDADIVESVKRVRLT